MYLSDPQGFGLGSIFSDPTCLGHVWVQVLKKLNGLESKRIRLKSDPSLSLVTDQ